MKNLFLLLLFSAILSSQSSVKAQSFYRPGYIVGLEGDTLRGLVGYRENKKSFEACLFKESEQASVKSFTPTDISAYGYVNDKIFGSQFIKSAPDDSSKVFLQVLARGKLNLYVHGNVFYIEKGNNKLLPLSIITEGNRRPQSNYHLDLMRDLTFDCKELGSNLGKLVLARRSLTDVVEKYNQCVSPATAKSIEFLKPWISFSKGVTVGISTSTLKFKDTHVRKEFLTKTDFTHRPSLNIGAFFFISSPQTSERFSLQVEATYNQDSYEGFAEMPGPYTATSRNYINADFSIAKAATLLRYSYPNSSSFLPYLSGGLSNSFVLKGTTTRKLEVDHGSGVIRESQEEAFTTPNHFFGLTAVIGTTYLHKGEERFIVEIKYDRGYKIHNNDRDLLRNSDARSTSHGLALVFGYFL